MFLVSNDKQGTVGELRQSLNYSNGLIIEETSLIPDGTE